MALVTHVDNIKLEGEDDPVFADICRWQTLTAGGEGFGLTVGTAIVFTQDSAQPKCHSHSHDEIYYLVSGEGITVVDGEEYVTKAGSCMWIPGGASHGFCSTGDKPAVLLYVFPCDSFEDVCYNHDEEPRCAFAPRAKPVVREEAEAPVQQADEFPNCRWQVLMESPTDRSSGSASQMTLLRTEIGPACQETRLNAHVHDEPELYFVLSGRGTIFMNGLGVRSLSPGSVCLIPRQTIHAIQNDTDQPLKLVDVFSASRLDQVGFRFLLDGDGQLPLAAPGARGKGTRSSSDAFFLRAAL